ncbi:MAG: ATP-binding protein, partial [Pseudomonadota bacterium]
RMPKRDGLSVAMTIRKEAPTVPITIISGHGSEDMVIEALRAGVTDFLAKPVRMEDLRAALSRMAAALEVSRQEQSILPSTVNLVESRWNYELENDSHVVSAFVDKVLKQLAPTVDLRTLTDLNLALRELLVNAIEHGNLGLSYEEKSTYLEKGILAEIVTSRAQQEPFKKRRITVAVQQRKSEVIVKIEDEGDGFDWRSLPDPTEPANLLRDHGRGVLLARNAVDALEYNEKGNVVTLKKKIKP